MNGDRVVIGVVWVQANDGEGVGIATKEGFTRDGEIAQIGGGSDHAGAGSSGIVLDIDGRVGEGREHRRRIDAGGLEGVQGDTVDLGDQHAIGDGKVYQATWPRAARGRNGDREGEDHRGDVNAHLVIIEDDRAGHRFVINAGGGGRREGSGEDAGVVATRWSW